MGDLPAVGAAVVDERRVRVDPTQDVRERGWHAEHERLPRHHDHDPLGHEVLAVVGIADLERWFGRWRPPDPKWWLSEKAA